MGFPTDFSFPDRSEEADPAMRAAVESWNAIAKLFLSQQRHRDVVAAELGLNMTEMIPLFHLDPQGGISQRELAQEWSCDPSWVTNRIDRLEELGLAERKVSPTDRRVKEVWLTDEGRARRAKGMAGFGKPPAELLSLPATDLKALAQIMTKVDQAAALEA